MHTMHKMIPPAFTTACFIKYSSSSLAFLLVRLNFIQAMCDVPNFTMFSVYYVCMLCWCTIFLIYSEPIIWLNLNETKRWDSIECDLFGSLLLLVFSFLFLFVFCSCFLVFSLFQFIELLFLDIITFGM